MESSTDRNNTPRSYKQCNRHKAHILQKDKVRASQKVNKDKISRPYDGERVEITRGLYDDVKKIINEINLKTELENFSYDIDPITRHLTLWMHYWEGITFESPQILSILGFKGIRNGTGYHIG